MRPVPATGRARSGSPPTAPIGALMRLRRVVWRAWWSRGSGFRRAVRALGLLLVSGPISLGLGAATAQASSPVGPHEAHWSTNLDSVVVLVHRPQAFAPLQAFGCVPLLLASHVHEERGMTAVDGERGRVNALTSGAGKGGTSIGPVTQETWLHELAFTSEGALIAWRAIILRPDASVTVGAWQGPPQPTGASAPGATDGPTAAPGPTGPPPAPGTAPGRGAAPATPASTGAWEPDPVDEGETRGTTRAEG
ncbi:hypothetical protein ABXS69_07220 [Actinomyces timonensis]|uniref:Uncharacterized protein n=1 Tax=Actinomyces timonensis TaxID=1288391 RepID=A0AAU8N337_9ACTO